MQIEYEKDYINRFIDFAAELQSRLKQGEVEYANQSFAKTESALISEIKEELLDVCNWSFILYTKLTRLEEIFNEERLSKHRAKVQQANEKAGGTPGE